MRRTSRLLAATVALRGGSLVVAWVLAVLAVSPVRGAPPPGGIRPGRVLVVANIASAASLELAAAYRQSRALPPMNVLFVSVSDPATIDAAEFDERIRKPLRQRCSLLDRDAIDYVVYCRDVPYRVGPFSITAATLFDGVGSVRPTHGYYRQERPFDSAVPCHGLTLHPASIVSGQNVADGLRLIADSRVRYPDAAQAGRFYFCDGAGPRGVRNPQIPAAVAALARRGALCDRLSDPSPTGRRDILGQFTGAEWPEVAGNRYLPGSILDNLTSFGGFLLDNRGQADLLHFVRHGVCGAYGTVAEPTNQLQRWADYTLPVRYLAGFSLMEAYLQTVQDWSLGLVVGDPLMAPFARPVAAAASLAPPPSAGDGPQRVRIEVREGTPGEGIAWVELWLNDQDRVYAFQPAIPAGTTARLSVTRGAETLYDRTVALNEAVSPARVVEQFVGQPPALARVEFRAAGKRGDKLLVRWRPEPGDAGTPALCTLRLSQGDTVHEVRHPLVPVPQATPCAFLECGAAEPHPGEGLTLTVQYAPYTVLAEPGETYETLLERLVAALRGSQAFAPEGAWQVELHPSPATGKRTQLRIASRSPTVPDTPLELALSVTRAEGSAFGQDVAPLPTWGHAAGPPLAETALTCVWPQPVVDTVVELPPNRCWPGHNEVLLLAATPGGDETATPLAVPIANPERACAVAVANPTVSLHQDLRLDLTAGPGLAAAHPELLVDGRVVCRWPPGSTRTSYRVLLPFTPPGPHQIQVQWTATGDLRSPVRAFLPLARTAPVPIFVRRPLLAGASFTPHEAVAGERLEVALRGPYLREGLTFRIGERFVPALRDRQGLTWVVSLPEGLEPGPYRVEVAGDEATETPGIFPDLLVVQPPPPPRHP